jgi:hypothetical protein
MGHRRLVLESFLARSRHSNPARDTSGGFCRKSRKKGPLVSVLIFNNRFYQYRLARPAPFVDFEERLAQDPDRRMARPVAPRRW